MARFKSQFGGLKPFRDPDEDKGEGSGVKRSPVLPTSPSRRMPAVRRPSESAFPAPTGYAFVAEREGFHDRVQKALQSSFPMKEPPSSKRDVSDVDVERYKPQIAAMRIKLLSDSAFFPSVGYKERHDCADRVTELLCIKLRGIESYESAAPILSRFFSMVNPELFSAWLEGKMFHYNVSVMNDPQRTTTPWRAVEPCNGNIMQWKAYNPAIRSYNNNLPLFQILIGLDL